MNSRDANGSVGELLTKPFRVDNPAGHRRRIEPQQQLLAREELQAPGRLRQIWKSALNYLSPGNNSYIFSRCRNGRDHFCLVF